MCFQPLLNFLPGPATRIFPDLKFIKHYETSTAGNSASTRKIKFYGSHMRLVLVKIEHGCKAVKDDI